MTGDFAWRVDDDTSSPCAAALRASTAATTRTTGSLRLEAGGAGAGAGGQFGKIEVVVVVVGVEINVVPVHVRCVRGVRGELGKPVLEFVQGWQKTDAWITSHKFGGADALRYLQTKWSQSERAVSSSRRWDSALPRSQPYTASTNCKQKTDLGVVDHGAIRQFGSLACDWRTSRVLAPIDIGRPLRLGRAYHTCKIEDNQTKRSLSKSPSRSTHRVRP